MNNRARAGNASIPMQLASINNSNNNNSYSNNTNNNNNNNNNTANESMIVDADWERGAQEQQQRRRPATMNFFQLSCMWIAYWARQPECIDDVVMIISFYIPMIVSFVRLAEYQSIYYMLTFFIGASMVGIFSLIAAFFLYRYVRLFVEARFGWFSFFLRYLSKQAAIEAYQSGVYCTRYVIAICVWILLGAFGGFFVIAAFVKIGPIEGIVFRL